MLEEDATGAARTEEAGRAARDSRHAADSSPPFQSGEGSCRAGGVERCGEGGYGRLAQDAGQVASYAFGFSAYLGGDIAALGDEAAEDGGLLEHGGLLSVGRVDSGTSSQPRPATEGWRCRTGASGR